MNQRQTLGKGLSYLFLAISSFVMVYPALYVVLGAFTTNDRFYETLAFPIPNTLNLAAFRRAFTVQVWDAYLFTLARCAFYVTLTVVVGLVGGYIFSKLRFPGRNPLFLVLLSGMVMPGVVMILPMFLMMSRFPNMGGNNLFGQGGHGLIGELPILFVFGWVPPFAIFLLKQAFDMVPSAYEDAAKIDGAGFFTILFQIYWPLLKPPIVALVIITFLAMWNDYLWPSLTISATGDFIPITMRLQSVIGNFDSATGGASPGNMIRLLLALWPPAAVYFLLQRYFVQGLVASGLKG